MGRFELIKDTNKKIPEEYRVLAIPQMPNIRKRDNLGKIFLVFFQDCKL